MPAHRGLVERPRQRNIFCLSVLLLLIFLAYLSKALADTLVEPDHALDVGNVTSGLQVDDVSGAASANLPFVWEPMPDTGGSDGAVTWTRARILREVGKQAIEQPGHFLIGAAPIWASRYLVGVPWFGWVAAPIIAYREWLQWPSNRWWDPPLDWACFALGAVAATWVRRPWHALAGGFAAIRQSPTWGLAIRGRMRHAG